MPTVIDIEVLNKLLASVAEEMGIVLMKSAFSPNIKERRDFSCAVFDGRGELLAQAAHIPVHLGSMPMALAAVLSQCRLGTDDVVIVNDPFSGGSHLPDISLVTAIYRPHHIGPGETPLYYVMNRAHHADVGGAAPGSMGMASTLAEEGTVIPPTFYYRNGRCNLIFLDRFLDTVRNPAERLGDLKAQLASLERGRVRLLALSEKYRKGSIEETQELLKNYAQRLMETAIAKIPAGIYSFTDYLDDSGRNCQPLPISVRLTVDNQRLTADFRDSAPQVASPVNTVRPVTMSAAAYVLQCLLGGGYPINHGSFRPLSLLTAPGTILDARPPAPVAAGNVETSQRIVDVLLGALAKALPQRIPAASCGSMNNIAVGGADYAYYETIAGGMGARPGSAGLDGVHTHMTNTLNTPIEALEHAYPMEIVRYGLIPASGGAGRHRGGNGIIRTYRFLAEAKVSLLTERRRLQPYGLAGGQPGRKGANLVIQGGKRRRLHGKEIITVQPGDLLTIRTPGGGGWGKNSDG